MSLKPFFNPDVRSIAFDAVPKMVKTRKRLKKVKKKFLEMSDSSTSPSESMPCRLANPKMPSGQTISYFNLRFSTESLHIYKYGTATFNSDTMRVGRTDWTRVALRAWLSRTSASCGQTCRMEPRLRRPARGASSTDQNTVRKMITTVIDQDRIILWERGR